MARKKKVKQAVGYCRVSSIGQQKNGSGLNRQEEIITEYARQAQHVFAGKFHRPKPADHICSRSGKKGKGRKTEVDTVGPQGAVSSRLFEAESAGKLEMAPLLLGCGQRRTVEQ